ASQVLATSPPTGLVVPIPVTTTLVRLIGSSFRADGGPAVPRGDRAAGGSLTTGGQDCCFSMYPTASPTVLRFFTSSSGMVTPNFSSAATTTSTIDNESTSRSSVKDLSSWTSSASMPVTSLTSSARPARISSVVAMVASSFVWCCELPSGGAS